MSLSKTARSQFYLCVLWKRIERIVPLHFQRAAVKNQISYNPATLQRKYYVYVLRVHSCYGGCRRKMNASQPSSLKKTQTIGKITAV